jgi:hypothetical protein
MQNTILFQYRGFVVGRWLCLAVDGMIVIVTAFGVASTFINIFAITPLRANWDVDVSATKHVDYEVWWLFSAIFNTLTAAVIWLLPIPLIRSLQLPPRQKCWIVVVFLLGVFTCIASGLRIESVWVGSRHADDDATYYTGFAMAWSSAEINVGIVCACLPSLKPLVDRVFPRLLHSPPTTRLSPKGSLVVDMHGNHPRKGASLSDGSGGGGGGGAGLQPPHPAHTASATRKSSDDPGLEFPNHSRPLREEV